jgi:hypothetical protein
MDSKRPSIADGFWMSLLVSGPLLSLAAFPYVPRSVSAFSLALCAAVATGFVLVPALRWAWRYLRDAREAAIDMAVTQPMPRHFRVALLTSAAKPEYSQPR